MPDELHRLLARQLRRAGADAATPPDATAWTHLLAAVGRTYVASEHDRYLLERALDLSSQEPSSRSRRATCSSSTRTASPRR